MARALCFALALACVFERSARFAAFLRLEVGLTRARRAGGGDTPTMPRVARTGVTMPGTGGDADVISMKIFSRCAAS